jgi:hypothetical protein
MILGQTPHNFPVLSSELSLCTEMVISSTNPMIFALSASTNSYNGVEYKISSNGDTGDPNGLILAPRPINDQLEKSIVQT